MLFRIKVCGVTSVDDARLAAQLGADAIGVNFWEFSPRRVSPETAHAIGLAVRGAAHLVGVFVNARPDTMRALAQDVGLDWIQLHGDEDAAVALELQYPIVQAVRGARASAAAVREYWAQASLHESGLRGFLIDADRPGTPGGTGTRADWAAARQLILDLDPLPIGLAGGLSPDNVSEAIHQVRPQAVDVASGVESAPGRKSEPLLAEFIRAARTAFRQIDEA